MTPVIARLALLQWPGTEPTISQRYAYTHPLETSEIIGGKRDEKHV